jgi:Fe-S-cluster containining protein
MKAPREVVPQKPVDEKLCTNCGKCCYQKIRIARVVYITPFPCEFLDTATNLCTIYDRRHELNPLCLSVPEGMKVSAFPNDCPYVPEHAPKNYRPALEHDWSKEWDEFDELADDLDVKPELREKIRARGPHAPPMYTEAKVPVLAELARESSAKSPETPKK